MDEEDGSSRLVDSRATARILSEARRQQSELQDELDDNNNETDSTGQFKKFQSNFIEQQKIRRNTESSDSDTDNESPIRQHGAANETYSDEEVSGFINYRTKTTCFM